MKCEALLACRLAVQLSYSACLMATYPNKIIDILNISPTFQILKISWNKACQIPVSKEKAVKYQGLIKEFKNVN